MALFAAQLLLQHLLDGEAGQQAVNEDQRFLELFVGQVAVVEDFVQRLDMLLRPEVEGRHAWIAFAAGEQAGNGINLKRPIEDRSPELLG